MMNSLRMFAMATIVLVLTMTDADAQSGVKLPTHQQLSRIGLERGWWGQAVLNPNRDKIKSVSVGEDIVVIQASSGMMTGFDAETGHQLWAIQLGRLDQISYPAVFTEDLSLIIVGSTLYALEKRSGRTMFSIVLPGQPSAGPTVDETRLYFGTLEGTLYAFNLKKIRTLFEQRRLPQWSYEAQEWKYRVAKEITSPPITNGKIINVASRDGSLYCLNASDRKLIYQIESDRPIIAPLTQSEDLIFMASEDQTLFAFNRKSGKTVWQFSSGVPIRKAPIALYNELFVLPERGGLYSLDPANGGRIWWQPNVSNFVCLMTDTVAASDDEGNLVILSRDKGEIAGLLPMRSFSVRSANERTDRIYLSTESGLLVCLRQIGHAYPTYHRFPELLPLLPPVESDESEGASETEEQMHAQ